MKKYFCDYTTSLALKELGFDESLSLFDRKVFYRNGNFTMGDDGAVDYWKNHCKNEIVIAPLISQALEYFREKHNILIDITDRSGFIGIKKFIYCISVLHTNTVLYMSGSTFGFEDTTVDFETYKEAEKEALLKAIEICKEKK